MSKRVIAAGRIDRKANRSHIAVMDNGRIGVEWKDGGITGGYVIPAEAPRCPECEADKHASCTGWALDDNDYEVGCDCTCRRREKT